MDWNGGQRKTLWVFSHTALWYTPGLPPVDIRSGLVADPEGKRRMEAFFCTDLRATAVQIHARPRSLDGNPLAMQVIVPALLCTNPQTPSCGISRRAKFPCASTTRPRDASTRAPPH